MKGIIIFALPAIITAAGAIASLACRPSAIVFAVNNEGNEDKMLQEAIRHYKHLKKTGKGLNLNNQTKGIHQL